LAQEGAPQAALIDDLFHRVLARSNERPIFVA
jgi:hypothetical protein